MPNQYVENILEKIKIDFGSIKKIGTGNSLYEILSSSSLIYFRYSKLSKRGNSSVAFYGLRKQDIELLRGRQSFICFVWDDTNSHILLPFNVFESYITQFPPSADGQYKILIFFKSTGTELYISKVGKFNIDAFYGLNSIYTIPNNGLKVPELSHGMLQSLLGAIGWKKGYKIWYPQSDREGIEKTIVDSNSILESLPHFGNSIGSIISEIDVIWFDVNRPVSFFEVEHSTPIYSGLLRFNDVLLSIAKVDNFNIVADSERESKFGREVNRPTFRTSKLSEKVAFLNYRNIYQWYINLFPKD